MSALMVSGLDDVALADRALQIGACGYIVKPFTANDVLMGVLDALQHRRSERQASAPIDASPEETAGLCAWGSRRATPIRRRTSPG
jgi:PleD family two-component response regulator